MTSLELSFLNQYTLRPLSLISCRLYFVNCPHCVGGHSCHKFEIYSYSSKFRSVNLIENLKSSKNSDKDIGQVNYFLSAKAQRIIFTPTPDSLYSSLVKFNTKVIKNNLSHMTCNSLFLA